MTVKNSLFDGLEWKRLESGSYLVEGYTIHRPGNRSAGKSTRWLIDSPSGKRIGQRTGLDAAVEAVRNDLDGIPQKSPNANLLFHGGR